MALTSDSLPEKLLKLTLRYQFRYQQAVERAKWEVNVLGPEIEKLKAGKSVLGLPDGVLFDMVIDESTDPPQAAVAEQCRHDSPEARAPRRQSAARARLRSRK